MNEDCGSALISPTALFDQRDDPSLILLDASFVLGETEVAPSESFRRAHLPGSQFFDIDRIADPETPLPHMLPTPRAFAEAAGSFGIGPESRVVIYDSNRFMASARVWWMFRVFGHTNVKVLDGGLGRWQALGLPLDSAETVRPNQVFRAASRISLVTTREHLLNHLADSSVEILDARPRDRFLGRVAEPRPGLRSGHIPGSKNVPFLTLLDPSTGGLHPPERLKATFKDHGFGGSRSVITTCGSGVTAAILALALFEIGQTECSVYDGSWAEWGLPGETPVAGEGPPETPV